MKQLTYFLWLSILCLLAACGGGETPEPSETTSFFEATGGTLNYSDQLGMSFMIGFKSDTLATDEVKVTIKGPSGWNADREVVRYYKAKQGETEVTWTNYFEDADEVVQPVVAGEYNATIVLGNEILKDNFTINTGSVLPKVEDISLSSLSEDAISVNWTGPSSAKSYQVEVLGTSSGKLTRPVFTTVAKTEASFQNLDLTPGGAYVVSVTALNTNYSDETTMVPDEQFNVSYTGLDFVVPE